MTYIGEYILIDEGRKSAEITISSTLQAAGLANRFKVSGLAILDRVDLPAHTGHLDVVGILEEDAIVIRHSSPDGAVTTITFSDSGTLEVEEVHVDGLYGRGVDFTGSYKRLP